MRDRRLPAAALTTLLGLTAVRPLIPPKTLGVADHEGVAVVVQRKDLLLLDRIHIIVQDFRWPDIKVENKVEWSYRRVILDTASPHRWI